MKKQIVSLVMAVILVFNVFSVPAQAEYTVHFNILPSMDEMERQFREWAAILVDYYGTTYAALDKAPILVDTIAWSNNHYKSKIVERKETIYHPYYWVAEQKEKFDVSLHANAENIWGDKVKETAYTLDLIDDPGKRQEIYTWLLIETLKEKAKVQPDFMTGTTYIEKNPGCYSFDIETGTMKYDSALNAVNEQAWANAKADLGKAAASLLEVVVTGCFVYDDLKAKGASIASNAVKEGQMDWSKVKSTLINGFRDAIKDTVFATIDKAVEDVRENFNNEMTNVIRGYLSAELANKMLIANANVIGYLRTTYVTDQIFTFNNAVNDVAGFRDAAANLINVIDSPDFKEATQSEAQRIVEEYTSGIMDFKEVLPTNVIVYNLASYALVSIVDGFFNALISTAQNALNQMIDNEPAWLKTATTSLKNFLIVDLMQTWILDSIKDGINDTLTAYAPDSGQELSADANEATIGIFVTSLFDNIVDNLDYVKNAVSLSTKLTTRAMTAVESLIFEGIINPHPDDTTTNQLNKADEEKKKENEKTNNPSGQVSSGDIVMDFVISIIATAFKTPIGNMSKDVSKTFSFLTDDEQAELKGYMSSITSAINGLEKNKNKQACKEIASSFLNLYNGAALIQIKYPDQKVLGAFGKAVQGSIDLSTDTAADVLTIYIKDPAFWAAVIGIGTDIDISNKKESTASNNKAPYDAIPDAEKKQTDSYQKKTEDASKEAEKGLAGLFSDIQKIVSSVWVSALDFSSDFWTAVYSTTNAITGEDLASLNATRIRVTADNSKVLEAALSIAVKGGRSKRQGNTGESDEAVAAVFDNDNILVWKMSAEDIRNPNLTPNLKHIKNLTDVIRMQMNLDVTGMGVYLTMVTNLSTFYQTSFYQEYLNGGVLLWPESAMNHYTLVLNSSLIGDGYNHEWDILFETTDGE